MAFVIIPLGGLIGAAVGCGMAYFVARRWLRP